MRSQLRRATERYRSLNSRVVSFTIAQAQPLDIDADQSQKENRLIRNWHIEKSGSINHEVAEKLDSILRSKGPKVAHQVTSKSNEVDGEKDNLASKSVEGLKKPDAVIIPDDFLCPISLELLRDPVIVATGQVWFAISSATSIFYDSICF